MKPQKDQLGLAGNYKQFLLLVIVNAFVGGMVGLERTIFPQYASERFGVNSTSALLSFIVAFGFTKALANYYAGKLADRVGRRNLLIIGWLVVIPVPFILIHTQNWSFVIFSNALLGISQGLTWSSTVVMKIDLVGERNRGLAMGLNEFAGYSAVGLVAFLTGIIANHMGIIPYPFYLGIFISFTGLLLTVLWVKDTRHFVTMEQVNNTKKSLENVFFHTSFSDRNLSTITQAGMVNNLNDGMIWGLLPVLLISYQYSNASMGMITATYPLVWGIGQLFTGKMSDHYSKKKMLFWGMLMQGIAILLLPGTTKQSALFLLSSILGLGTALVYPTFLSSIAMFTSPMQRAECIGTFRFWRDLGYAIGAVISGVVADWLGVSVAISTIGLFTILSAMIIRLRMDNI